jgi:hypothetical protein
MNRVIRKAKRKKGQKDKQWSPNYYTENQRLLYTNPTEKPKHSPAFLSKHLQVALFFSLHYVITKISFYIMERKYQ